MENTQSTFKPRLRMVPGKSKADPLFTRDQKVFLSESLILIGTAIVALLFLLSPGTSRAAAGFEGNMVDRLQEIHQNRIAAANAKKEAIQVAGKLTCTSTETKTTPGGNGNCTNFYLEEFGTGKKYTLKNAEMAANLIGDGVTQVRITGKTTGANRTVAANATGTAENGNVITVTNIEKLD